MEANVRIITATHQDLPWMVKEGKFRGDLFFRLNVMNISLPKLRDRKEDIESLVQYFIETLNEEYCRSMTHTSTETLEFLNRYDWPGNVRELRNCIERLMMLEQGKVLTPEFLSPEIKQCKLPAADQDYTLGPPNAGVPYLGFVSMVPLPVVLRELFLVFLLFFLFFLVFLVFLTFLGCVIPAFPWPPCPLLDMSVPSPAGGMTVSVVVVSTAQTIPAKETATKAVMTVDNALFMVSLLIFGKQPTHYST